jgi:hypothetical protein
VGAVEGRTSRGAMGGSEENMIMVEAYGCVARKN